MDMEWLKSGALIGSFVYALMGVIIFVLSFVIIDKLTPYDLWLEIVEKQNRALALVVAAMSLGIANAAMQCSLDWVRERQIGPKPLAAYQGTQWRLAEMYAQLEGARMLTWKAAVRRDSGERFSLDSATAKLVAAESAGFITDAALQLHGGYGYIRDLPLERYVRDARILRIFEGTSEVQKIIISRGLLEAR